VPQSVGTLFLPVAGLQQMLQQLNETARRIQEQQAERDKVITTESEAKAADDALTNL
jgi:hypothetical protein